MQGSNQGQNYGSTDWLNKASPDEIVSHATTVFQTLAKANPAVRQRFVSQIRNDPSVRSLLEELSPATT